MAHLRPAETLLVHGGSNGIGTMAIQLGKAIGARVAVTAGSAEKLEACRALGADVLINYREQDFVEAVGPQGADVILDVIGAKYLDRNLDALAVNGRPVVIGMQGGIKAELNLGKLMAKRAAVAATGLRARPLVESGVVRPVVDRVLPLADAAQAHRLMESSTHIGRSLRGPGADHLDDAHRGMSRAGQEERLGLDALQDCR